MKPDCQTSCQITAELLPWLLNGSLEESERVAVVEHLAACAGCRDELEATAQVWDLATRHIPSLALAEYAQGLTPGEMDAASIERHLGSCPSCRQELEWAASDRVLELERPAPRSDAGSRRRESWWRHAALAAGLAAVLSSAGLIWSLRDSGRSGDPALTADRSQPAASREVAGGTGQLPDDGHGTMTLFSNGFEEGDIVWSGSRNTGESSPSEPPSTQKRRRI